ncbi:hypothetical protein ACFO9E_18125 [Streptomyces maoxianensis]|uniref:DUF4402 domain-containing protein n=1 Tax=Streptomyces maoxianensis TaxID=1459942 RepID=A0ABV9G5Y9_9ACTN
MPFLSGDRLTSARMNAIQPVPYHEIADALLTKTTTTYEDISGCSVTFDTTTDFAIYVVEAGFDCAVGTSSAGTDMNGRIVVDGIAEPGLAKHQMDNLDRDTVFTSARGTLATPGSHTIKLQGALSAAAGSGTFQTLTSILVTIYEVP